MCGECEEKETFNVMINMKPCTMIRQVQSVSWESCKISLWKDKLSLCSAQKVVLLLGKPQFVQRLMC